MFTIGKRYQAILISYIRNVEDERIALPCHKGEMSETIGQTAIEGAIDEDISLRERTMCVGDGTGDLHLRMHEAREKYCDVE